MNSDQNVLFESEEAFARRTDPVTSHQAASKVVNLGKTRDLILRVLNEKGPMIDEQIVEAYNAKVEILGPEYKASPSGIRSRRAELVRLGKVKEQGELRKTRMGRLSIVWMVK